MIKNLIIFCLISSSSFAYDKKLADAGKKIFLQNCIACHGEKGDGKGPAAAAISGNKPRNFTKEAFKNGDQPEQIFKTISTGVEGSAMPPWGHLPESERWQLVNFILKLRSKK